MAKRLNLEVTDMAALKAKYPDTVETVTVEKVNHSALYEKAKAHLTLGVAIPGVRITAPDGRIMAEVQMPGVTGTVTVDKPEGQDDA